MSDVRKFTVLGNFAFVLEDVEYIQLITEFLPGKYWVNAFLVGRDLTMSFYDDDAEAFLNLFDIKIHQSAKVSLVKK